MRASRVVAMALLGACMIVLSLPAAGQRGGAAAEKKLAYDDVKLLLMARYLCLTREQTAAIVPIATEVAVAKTALNATVDEEFKEAAPALAQLMEQELSGKRADAAAVDAADGALDRYDDAYDKFDKAVIAATGKAMATFSARQKTLVETEEQTKARLEMAERASVAPVRFIVERLQLIRALEPADYDAVRPLLAHEIADYLMFYKHLPDDARWPVSRDVLRLMDTVMDWSNAEFADRLKDLPDDVAETFELPPADAAPVAPRLTLDQIDRFLASPATAEFLAEMQFPQTPAPPPPLYGFVNPGVATGAQRLAETTDTRHEFDQLLDMMDAVTMFNDLGVSDRQLAAFQPAVSAMMSAYNAQRGAWQSVLTAQHANLQAIRETLLAGTPLTEQHNDVLYDLQQEQGELALEILYAAAISLRAVRDALDENQNSRIDWRPPQVLEQAEPLEDRIERLLDLADRITGFTDFLKEVRFIEPIGFQDGATKLTGDFLAQYIRDDGGRYFNRAVRYMIDIEIEAREVPEEDWNDAVAAMIAFQAMTRLRLLPRRVGAGMDRPAADDVLYTWWDMERIFSDPLLPGVFARLMQPPAPQ